MPSRIIIIGNSGSGKSHLAEELARAWNLPVVSLDQLFWLPGSSYGEKRPAALVHAELAARKQAERWIIEGVFGELAALVLDRADSLVWLDVAWTDCRTALLTRGYRVSEEAERTKLEESFQRLLTWAEAYWSRTDLRSHSGHAALYDAFSGSKHRCTDRVQVNAWRDELTREASLAAVADTADAKAPFALLINGPINSGKSTVARELRRLRPRLAHVEVDALGEFLPELPFEEKIALSLRQATVVARTLLDSGFSVVVTYPLRETEHGAVLAALAPFPVHTVTLAPPREVAQKNRGSRPLSEWEHERIDHHYTTGLHRPSFGHVLDNSAESPADTAARIRVLVEARRRSASSAAIQPAIRAAIPADASAIARINVEAWRAAYRGIIPDAHLDTVEVFPRIGRWEKALRENTVQALVAGQAGTVLGWLSFGPCRDEGETHEAEVQALYIDPFHQRSGLGGRLLAEAGRRLAASQPTATRIIIWVLEQNNAARAFYVAQGYAPDGATRTATIGGAPLVELRHTKPLGKTTPVTTAARS